MQGDVSMTCDLVHGNTQKLYNILKVTILQLSEYSLDLEKLKSMYSHFIKVQIQGYIYISSHAYHPSLVVT